MRAEEIKIGQEVCFEDNNKYPILGHGIVKSLFFALNDYNGLVLSAEVRWTEKYKSTVPVSDLVNFESEIERKLKRAQIE